MKIFRHLLFHSFILLFFHITSYAQYRIEGQIKGLTGGDCILANNYIVASLYPKDTAKVDANGRLVIEGNKPLPQGIYELVLPNRRLTIRLIIGKEQYFSFSTDTLDILGTMKVKGSPDTELFYGFQQEMKNYENEAKQIQALKSTDFDKKIKAIQDKRKAYYDKFMVDNAKTFVVTLFKAAADPEIPPAPKLPNGKTDSLWSFNYYKTHFWDNYNFADERLLRTPFLNQKLERYVKELTVQTEDSIMKTADFLVKKALTGKQQDAVSYTIGYITREYEQTKIVGTEGVFVQMAEKYILTGIMPMSDTSSRKAYRDRIAVLKPLLINKIIPDLGMQGERSNFINIHDLTNDYNVVFFYSPSCGHCKESAPKLKAFQDKYKDKGVSVMTIATEGSEEDWRKFIKEYKWEGLVNGYGRTVTRSVEYNKDYDVFSTPTIYIIDKTHKIIARRIGIEDLDPFLTIYKKQKLAKTEKQQSK
jgi:thiol-disulfide isomerase/thioredoxin